MLEQNELKIKILSHPMSCVCVAVNDNQIINANFKSAFAHFHQLRL